MKVKCPNCSHKFTPSEDELYLDYEIDYDYDERFVWEKLPILKSSFVISESTKEEEN
ncbi:hypothetical protein [Nitrosopumilus sp.]|uniref:hypothetical protein n=1 Tax=Nitrosopumilus sp. TaxID=2024843 RepID=UPI00293102AD|nr:hypothetical protein [Nitrosopumilus sp.]